MIVIASLTIRAVNVGFVLAVADVDTVFTVLNITAKMEETSYKSGKGVDYIETVVAILGSLVQKISDVSLIVRVKIAEEGFFLVRLPDS